MKSTLKILALLIALAIPTQAKAGYTQATSNTWLVYKSEFTNNTTWGNPGYIWQVCDYDYNWTTYQYDLHQDLEITLNDHITIVGPIYVPHNKRLIIHTNGYSITPLQARQEDWSTTYLHTITNGTEATGNYSWDIDDDGYEDAVDQYRDNVPLCSFFV